MNAWTCVKSQPQTLRHTPDEPKASWHQKRASTAGTPAYLASSACVTCADKLVYTIVWDPRGRTTTMSAQGYRLPSLQLVLVGIRPGTFNARALGSQTLLKLNSKSLEPLFETLNPIPWEPRRGGPQTPLGPHLAWVGICRARGHVQVGHLRGSRACAGFTLERIPGLLGWFGVLDCRPGHVEGSWVLW